jgi:hypothetical protein
MSNTEIGTEFLLDVGVAAAVAMGRRLAESEGKGIDLTLYDDAQKVSNLLNAVIRDVCVADLVGQHRERFHSILSFSISVDEFLQKTASFVQEYADTERFLTGGALH